MNQQQFEIFQYAAEDQLLEEAQAAGIHRSRYWGILALAACFCAVVLVAAVWKPWSREKQAQLGNPVEEVTAATIQTLGYRMEIPKSAKNVVYSTVDVSAESEVPMAQVRYDLGTQAYTYRALKTAESADISGISQTWTNDLSWDAGDAKMRLCSNDTDAWVGWYDPDEGTQWCLSSEGDETGLLNDALSLAKDLGIDFSTAPEGAEDVTVDAFEQDGLTVAQTQFTYSGIRYAYRTASTPEVTLTDISGQQAQYTQTAQFQVSWCNAQLSFTPDGSGKILWLDVVPGLVYSLSVEQGASAQALTDMANTLFVPAQGDVG